MFFFFFIVRIKPTSACWPRRVVHSEWCLRLPQFGWLSVLCWQRIYLGEFKQTSLSQAVGRASITATLNKLFSQMDTCAGIHILMYTHTHMHMYLPAHTHTHLHLYTHALTLMHTHTMHSVNSVFFFYLNFCSQWGVKLWPISWCVSLQFLSAWSTTLPTAGRLFTLCFPDICSDGMPTSCHYLVFHCSCLAAPLKCVFKLQFANLSCISLTWGAFESTDAVVHPQGCDSLIWAQTQEYAFITSSWAMLMLLVQGQYFKRRCPGLEPHHWSMWSWFIHVPLPLVMYLQSSLCSKTCPQILTGNFLKLDSTLKRGLWFGIPHIHGLHLDSFATSE